MSAVKRLLDVAAAGAGLVVLSPALAAIALVVKASSRGPVLYGHERVGRGWSRFKVWKFRTMAAGADRVGPAITAGGDPRITRAGRVLRRTKLDELPQLWNVLVGDMSLVGPRPEAPRYAEAYRADYDVILTVRPGITDEASIRFVNEEQVLATAEDPERAYLDDVLPEKITLYRKYVDSHSLATDLSILVRTIARILRP